MRTVCLAMDLRLARPVCCYILDERAFTTSIRSIVQSVADGSLAYAEWATPDGRFRIKRK
jgi:hypothetical protein